ncbi:MAG: long-chain fatty acid--CoA ligase [Nitrospirae bacterium]|nr:MAG: long-chain fatty acid--CoA ligase [Nitrospirota bacterium]
MRYATLPEMFFSRADHFGGADCLQYREGDRYHPISWEQLARRVAAVAAGLVAHGVRPGDRVGLLSENRPEWALADLAILSAGAITVPLYPNATAPQVRHILAHSEACLCLCSTEEQLEKVVAAKEGCPELRRVVCFDRPPGEQPEYVRPLAWLEDPLHHQHVADPERCAAASGRGPDDPASIIYTSGTTGEPKGVVLTHRNFLANVEAGLAAIPVYDTDICLSFLPLSHVLERTVGFFAMLYGGATIAYARSVYTVGEDLPVARPTLLVSVPRLYEKIYARIWEAVQQSNPVRRAIFAGGMRVAHRILDLRLAHTPIPRHLEVEYRIVQRLVTERLRERMGGRLRLAISGGAPLNPTIGRFFNAAGIPVLEGYGLTEASPVITVNRLESNRIGTVGPPLPGIEVKIAEDGEILTRSPCVMQGYYKNPEATAEAIDADGWLHTGDIGRFDEAGCLVITDRKKDLIVTSGGKNVAPQEIETRLALDRFIDQAVVYGDGHNYLTALIVPDLEQLRSYARIKSLSVEDDAALCQHPRVLDLLRRRIDLQLADLARYQQIKRFVVRCEPLTVEGGDLTPTLKVRRARVYERYRDLFESMYEE